MLGPVFGLECSLFTEDGVLRHRAAKLGNSRVESDILDRPFAM
jgi:hypothetical protein